MFISLLFILFFFFLTWAYFLGNFRRETRTTRSRAVLERAPRIITLRSRRETIAFPCTRAAHSHASRDKTVFYNDARVKRVDVINTFYSDGSSEKIIIELKNRIPPTGRCIPFVINYRDFPER